MQNWECSGCSKELMACNLCRLPTASLLLCSAAAGVRLWCYAHNVGIAGIMHQSLA